MRNLAHTSSSFSLIAMERTQTPHGSQTRLGHAGLANTGGVPRQPCKKSTITAPRLVGWWRPRDQLLLHSRLWASGSRKVFLAVVERCVGTHDAHLLSAGLAALIHRGFSREPTGRGSAFGHEARHVSAYWVHARQISHSRIPWQALSFQWKSFSAAWPTSPLSYIQALQAVRTCQYTR